MAQKLQLEVSKKEQVTDHIYFVTFRLFRPQTINFRAGQNMMLTIAPGVNRTMSIASAPSELPNILMVHDVSPMGPGSKWTLALRVGDKVDIVGPTGGALSFVASPRKKVMVATGTGVAPFHAMVLDYLEKQQVPPTVPTQNSLVLYWGLRHEEDMYWKEEFDRIAHKHPEFVWHQILSQPGEHWKGLTGHVTEHVLEKENDMEKCEFYLCGNKAMVDEVRNKLIERNVPKEQIKTELFY